MSTLQDTPSTPISDLVGDDSVFVSGGEQPTDEEKRSIISFVMAAPRWARRQVVRTGQTTWRGMKVIGKGIYAALPWLFKGLLVMSGIAMIVGGVWLNISFFQYLSATNPWLFYGFIAAAIIQVMASLGFFAYAKGRLSGLVPNASAAAA